MFYAVGRISDQGTSPNYGFIEAGTTSVGVEPFMLAIASNYGGNVSDYKIYTAADNCLEAQRYHRGDEFSLVWNSDNITGLDFTKEDSYRIMRFYVTDHIGNVTDTLIANGTDYLVISASVWNSTMSTLDTSFNGDVLVPLIDPDKRTAYIKVSFVNGMTQKNFKTTKYGIWHIPNNFKFRDINVKTTNEVVLDINALMDL